MKLAFITFFIVFLTLCHLIECDKINVTVLGRAMADIIDCLSESHSMRFEVALASDNAQLKLLSNEIVKLTKSPVRLIYLHDKKDHVLYMGSPLIWLMDNQNSSRRYGPTFFKKFEKGTGILNRLTTTYVDAAWIIFKMGSDDLFFEPKNDRVGFYYQIIHSKVKRNDLVLYSVTYQSLESCDAKWKVVNNFSAKAMSWKNSSKFVQTYDTFFNCFIQVGLLPFAKFRVFDSILNYKSEEKSQVSYGGVFGEMLKIFTKKYNVQMAKRKCIRVVNQELEINCDITLMPLRITDLDFVSRELHVTQPILYIYSTFLITEGHFYNEFEKFALPFDVITWICLVVTFLLSFTFIFIIYRLPKEIQNYVFGTRVYYPSLGTVQLFFGLGYVHLPKENFSRILFIAFTMFCLVIRTAYQGKMYDFIVTEVRHPMPRTVEELFASGIHIISDDSGIIDMAYMWVEMFQLFKFLEFFIRFYFNLLELESMPCKLTISSKERKTMIILLNLSIVSKSKNLEEML